MPDHPTSTLTKDPESPLPLCDHDNQIIEQLMELFGDFSEITPTEWSDPLVPAGYRIDQGRIIMLRLTGLHDLEYAEVSSGASTPEEAREEILMSLNLMIQLDSLQALDIGNNNLGSISVDLSPLVHLKELNLSSNKLLVIPPWVKNITQLEALYLGDNHLTDLPKWIVEMKKLRILDLSFNRFTTFPQSIIKCLTLKELDISCNQLNPISGELLSILDLDVLEIHDNMPSN